MAIFTNTTEEVIVSDIEPTIECAQEILYEFNENVNKVISASYISDVILESSINNGINNIEELTEGVVQDMIDKYTYEFNQLLAKIKSWFGQISRYFFDISKRATEFVSKHENEIKESLKTKFNNKYVYNGKEFQNETTFIRKAQEYLNMALVSTTYKNISDMNVNSTGSISDVKEMSKENADNVSEGVEKMVHQLAGIKSEIERHFIKDNVDDTLREITVDDKKLETYITVCKNSKDIIKTINGAEKNVLGEINKATKLLKSSKNGANATEINSTVKFYRSLVTSVQSINTTIINIYKKMLSQYFKCLNSILNSKKPKES